MVDLKFHAGEISGMLLSKALFYKEKNVVQGVWVIFPKLSSLSILKLSIKLSFYKFNFSVYFFISLD